MARHKKTQTENIALLNKPVPLGPPLTSTEAELAALSNPSQADIDAAIAHWLKYAPARAKGLLLAQVDDPLADNAENTPTTPA